MIDFDGNPLNLIYQAAKVLAFGAVIVSTLSTSFIFRKAVQSVDAMGNVLAESFWCPMFVMFFWFIFMFLDLLFVAMIEQFIAALNSTLWYDLGILLVSVILTAGALLAGYWEARTLRASFFMLQ